MLTRLFLYLTTLFALCGLWSAVGACIPLVIVFGVCRLLAGPGEKWL
jgi:hypothetical protein